MRAGSVPKRPDGTTLKDYDILLKDGTVIQVKEGSGQGMTRQMKVTALSTGGRVIAYGPDLGGSLERGLRQLGFELYRNPGALISALRSGKI